MPSLTLATSSFLCAPPLQARTTRVRSAARNWLAKIEYGEMQHAGVLVKDTAKSIEFYTKVLGMVDESHMRNPKLPYPGAFMGCGANQIHLMELPIMDPLEGRPEHGGRDRHVAVTVKSLDPLVESLDQHGVVYTMSQSGRRALFCRDIDQNAIEFVETP